MSKDNLTPLQKAFLDALFGDARGDPARAKKLAGYAPETRVSEVMEPLHEIIADRARQYLAYNSVKAAIAMVGVMDAPDELGAEKKLAAAEKILDRAGVVKREKLEVSGDQVGLFILPSKRQE